MRRLCSLIGDRRATLEGGLRFAGRMPDAEDRPRLLTRWSYATRR